jgi:hypothetical protein
VVPSLRVGRVGDHVGRRWAIDASSKKGTHHCYLRSREELLNGLLALLVLVGVGGGPCLGLLWGGDMGAIRHGRRRGRGGRRRGRHGAAESVLDVWCGELAVVDGGDGDGGAVRREGLVPVRNATTRIGILRVSALHQPAGMPHAVRTSERPTAFIVASTVHSIAL